MANTWREQQKATMDFNDRRLWQCIAALLGLRGTDYSFSRALRRRKPLAIERQIAATRTAVDLLRSEQEPPPGRWKAHHELIRT